MPFRLLIGVAAAVLCATVAGCGDPLGPEDVAGSYALQRVESDPLPAVLYSTEQVIVRIHADTLRLSADGEGMAIGVYESEPRPGQPGAPSGPTRSESPLRFRIARGRIEIEYVCPPNALCVSGPHIIARRVRGGLRVDYALGERVPQLYARVEEM